MRPPDQDLPHRRPVWIALSDLYLDNELSLNDFEHLAEQLAVSPYSAEELRYILLVEVHPVCAGNLRQVAGVWSAFDPDWLEENILRRQRSWLRRLGRFTPFAKQISTTAASLFARVAELRHSA